MKTTKDFKSFYDSRGWRKGSVITCTHLVIAVRDGKTARSLSCSLSLYAALVSMAAVRTVQVLIKKDPKKGRPPPSKKSMMLTKGSCCFSPSEPLGRLVIRRTSTVSTRERPSPKPRPIFVGALFSLFFSENTERTVAQTRSFS
jgi:hypothetical protein